MPWHYFSHILFSLGSYRLLAAGDPFLASGGAGGGYLLNSSQSDVGSVSTAPPVMDQRLLYHTTFTTKRVGNVIVKRVQPTVAAMPTGSTMHKQAFPKKTYCLFPDNR